MRTVLVLWPRERNPGKLETVNGGIKLERDVTVNGGIETVNGSIFVDRGGKLKDGVETVNGAIGLVGTHLGGGIATVNGDITVGFAPDECLAVEDSPVGAAATHAAGVRAIVIPSAEPVPPKPTYTFRASLEGLTLADLAVAHTGR